MKRKEKNIDELIQQSLSQEEAKFYNDLDEPSIMESFMQVFKGKNKWLTYYLLIIMLAFVGIAIYSLVQFLEVETVQEMLKWGAAMFGCFISVGFLKIYYWMQMDKNVILRDIKRVGLQVSLLQNKLDEIDS